MSRGRSTPLDDSAARAYDAYSYGHKPININNAQAAIRGRRAEQERKVAAKAKSLSETQKALALLEKDIWPPYAEMYKQKTQELMDNIESGEFDEQDINSFISTEYVDIMANNNQTKKLFEDLTKKIGEDTFYMPIRETIVDEETGESREIVRPANVSDLPNMVKDIANAGYQDIEKINEGLYGGLSGGTTYTKMNEIDAGMQTMAENMLDNFGDEDIRKLSSFFAPGRMKIGTEVSLDDGKASELYRRLMSYYPEFAKSYMGTRAVPADEQEAEQIIQEEFSRRAKSIVDSASKSEQGIESFYVKDDSGGPEVDPPPAFEIYDDDFGVEAIDVSTSFDKEGNATDSNSEILIKSQSPTIQYATEQTRRYYEELEKNKGQLPEPDYLKGYKDLGEKMNVVAQKATKDPENNKVIQIPLPDLESNRQSSSLNLPGGAKVSSIGLTKIIEDGTPVYYVHGTQVKDRETFRATESEGFQGGPTKKGSGVSLGSSTVAESPYFRKYERAEEVNNLLNSMYKMDIDVNSIGGVFNENAFDAAFDKVTGGE